MVDFAKIREQNKQRLAMSPEQKAAEIAMKLDHAPLAFGKYKGQSPSDIAQTTEGANWLVWAYENVKNRQVCSELLARDCGWKPPISQSQAEAVRVNTAKHASFDEDYDDDIPF